MLTLWVIIYQLKRSHLMESTVSRSLKKVAGIFLSALLLVCTPGVAADATTLVNQAKASWLFVQLANSGSFEAVAGNSNQYTLTLNGISPCMISFTDRPAREARITATKQFSEEWQNDAREDNYRDNPPNATLVLSTDKFEDIFVLCLENPRYDEKNQTLVYKATRIPLTKERSAADLQCRVRAELPKTFNQSALFIDNSWGSIGG